MVATNNSNKSACPNIPGVLVSSLMGTGAMSRLEKVQLQVQGIFTLDGLSVS